MGRKCVAPACTSGYASNRDEKKSVFTFPKDNEMRQKWIRAVPRANWDVSGNSAICELHFHASDFKESREDNNHSRVSAKGEELCRKELKPDAVPSVWPSCPSYLSSNTPRRSQKATAENRERTVMEYQLHREAEMLEADTVTTSNDILEKKHRFQMDSNTRI